MKSFKTETKRHLQPIMEDYFAMCNNPKSVIRPTFIPSLAY